MVGLAILLNMMLNDLLQVPQRSPSESRYIIDAGKLIYIQHGTPKRNVLNGVEKGARFFQSGNVLIVADEKLRVYRGKELVHSTDSLPSRFFYEWDGNDIYCGFFDRERVVVEKYNRKNQILKSDAIVGKQRHVLYSGGKISSFRKNGNLYLWIPAYDLFLSYDNDLTNLEHVQVVLPTVLEKFDGTAFERYADAADKGTEKGKAEYVKANRGDLIRVEPVALVEIQDEPVFTYNCLETGSRVLSDGEIEVMSYTLFITLDGKVVKRDLGGQFVGLAGGKFLVKIWDHKQNHHVYKEVTQ